MHGCMAKMVVNEGEAVNNESNSIQARQTDDDEGIGV